MWRVVHWGQMRGSGTRHFLSLDLNPSRPNLRTKKSGRPVDRMNGKNLSQKRRHFVSLTL